MNKTTILSLVTCVFLAALSDYAQSGTAILSAAVSSADGAVVPNASVDVINTSTNESKHALSGNDGRFTLDGLTPGNIA